MYFSVTVGAFMTVVHNSQHDSSCFRKVGVSIIIEDSFLTHNCCLFLWFALFPCLRSGSVKNHWEEIYYFVENLAEKFKR